MSTIESLETDSGVIQDPKKISQSFARYFSTAIAKLRQRMTSVLSVPRPPANRSSNNFKLSQVSESFAAKELKELKSNKYWITKYPSTTSQGRCRRTCHNPGNTYE